MARPVVIVSTIRATASQSGWADTSAAFCRNPSRQFLPLPRVHQAADEEDDSAARVADQEEERVIGAEDNRLFGHAHSGGVHGDAGGGGGFGSLLCNIDESLVDDLGDRQAAVRVDA